MKLYPRPKVYGFFNALYTMSWGKWTAKIDKKVDKKLKEQSPKRHRFHNLFILMLNTSRLQQRKMVSHLKSTGVHLGLITKLIESDIFLSGFWDPPSCQSAPILFAFPLILLLLWDEQWAHLTSKTCLKHSLAFRIKVRSACQGRGYGKGAMTASRWQKPNVTITVRVFVLNLRWNLLHTE